VARVASKEGAPRAVAHNQLGRTTTLPRERVIEHGFDGCHSAGSLLGGKATVILCVALANRARYLTKPPWNFVGHSPNGVAPRIHVRLSSDPFWQKQSVIGSNA